MVFQHAFQARGGEQDGGGEPPGFVGEAEYQGQEEERGSIERQDGVPGGKPVKRGGEQQVGGWVAPQMVGQLAVDALEKALVGGVVEEDRHLAVQGEEAAGPEIQAVAQGLAGEAVALAPENGESLVTGRDG